MSRLSKEQHEEYMKSIMDLYENPDDAADMLSALRSDFDESLTDEDTVPKAEYDALKEKYMNRFFEGDQTGTNNNHNSKPKDEPQSLSFDDLFNYI